MIAIASSELAHIPDWPSHQALLRSTYWNLRLNSLGKKAAEPDDPLTVVQRAAMVVRTGQPEVQLEYDKAFFRIESKKWIRSSGKNSADIEALKVISEQENKSPGRPFFTSSVIEDAGFPDQDAAKTLAQSIRRLTHGGYLDGEDITTMGSVYPEYLIRGLTSSGM